VPKKKCSYASEHVCHLTCVWCEIVSCVLCSGIHDGKYALIRKYTRNFLLEGSVHDIITGCIEYLQYYTVVSKCLIVLTRSKICMLINEHPLQIFFFFFFYWHYNPLWILAFSVILFHSALSLHNFLHPLIPILCIYSSVSSVHLFLGLPLILLHIGFHSNTLLGVSPTNQRTEISISYILGTVCKRFISSAFWLSKIAFSCTNTGSPVDRRLPPLPRLLKGSDSKKNSRTGDEVFCTGGNLSEPAQHKKAIK